MSDNERLVDLLLHYEELRDQGQSPTPEEICAGCPELRGEFRRRLAFLRDERMAPDGEGDSASTLNKGQSDHAGKEKRQASASPAISGYEVYEELGRGGMGVVYKARHIALKRIVALKMIRTGAHAEPSELARFRTEAEAVAKLQHPNIVQIYDIGEVEGLPYFSLEFCGGGTLADALQTGPFEAQAAAALTANLAWAMHAAHQRHIVHRDLKPANILLSDERRIARNEQDTDKGRTTDNTQKSAGLVPSLATRHAALIPKISDFGLAKRLDADSGQTHTEAVIGTPSYMSPEQAAGATSKAGPAADIYALGAILYELITGRPPFRAADKWKTVEQVLKEEPVPPRRLQPDTPRDLETICLKCLEKEPRRRYATAAELAEDLGRLSAGEPILARPVGRLELTAKWARRHPASATAIMVGCIGVAALSCLSLVLWNTVQSRDQALQDRGTALQTAQAEQSKAQASEAQAQRFRYAAEARLLGQSWKEGNIKWCREILLRNQAEDGSSPAYAGFEWSHFARLLRQSEGTTPQETAGAVNAAAFAPDDATVATGNENGSITLWDRATWQRRAHWQAHAAGVVSLAFVDNGRKLVSTAKDGAIRLWNGKDHAQLAEVRAQLGPLAVSPNGQWAACATPTQTPGIGQLQIWDLTTGKLRGQPTLAVRAIDCLAFSPDSATLALGGADTVVHELDMVKEQVLRAYHDHPVLVTALAFSPDAKLLAVGSSDGRVFVHQRGDGLPAVYGWRRSESFQAHQDPVTHLMFSADGERVISKSTEGAVQFWSVLERASLPPLRQQGPTRGLALSHDGELLVHVGNGNDINVRKVAERMDAVPPTTAFRASGPVAFSGDGQLVAVACADHSIEFIKASTGESTGRLRGHRGELRGLAFLGKSSAMISVGNDRTVRSWDVMSQKALASVATSDFPLCVACAPDGNTVAVGMSNGQVRRWDSALSKELAALPGLNNSVRTVVFSPDGGTIAAAGDEGQIRFWDAASGMPRQKEPIRMETAILRLAYSPDGRVLAAASVDRDIHTWDAESGKQLAKGEWTFHAPTVGFVGKGKGQLVFPLQHALRVAAPLDLAVNEEIWGVHPVNIREIACSPQGRQVATVSMDGIVKIWDINTRRYRKPASQWLEPIHALALTPDCKTVFLGTDMQRPEHVFTSHWLGRKGLTHQRIGVADDLRRYDLAGKEGPLLPKQSSYGIRCLTVTPDGKKLLAGSAGGAVFHWDLAAAGPPEIQFVNSACETYWRLIEKTSALVPVRPEYKQAVVALAAFRDGKRYATLTDVGDVQILDLETGKELLALPKQDGALSLLVLPNDRALVVNSGAELGLWDPATGQLKTKLKPGHFSRILAIDVDSAGKTLFTCADDRQILLTSLADQSTRVLISQPDRLISLAISPDGRTLATGSREGAVRLWNVETLQELTRLEGHTGPVWRVAFAPDGSALVTAGESRTGGGEAFIWRGR